MNKKVLLVFSNIDNSIQEIQNKFIGNLWNVFFVQEQELAIDYIKKEFPLIIICPDKDKNIDGFQLFEETKKIFSNTYTLMVIKDQNFQSALRAFELRVYEILTETNPEKIYQISENILSSYQLKEAQKIVEEHKEELIRERFESLYWKESMNINTDFSVSLSLVRTLRNYLAQANIGALISLVKLIEETFVPDEKNMYQIDKEFMAELFQNSRVGEKILESLNKYITLATNKYNFENFSYSEFFTLLFGIVDQIGILSKAKNVIFIKGASLYLNQNSLICYDKKRIEIVMRELIVNAAKFSKKGDKVYIIPISSKKKIGFQIINHAHEFRKGVAGIPFDYQKKVFEPFFRMMEYHDTSYFEEEVTLGLGLGLTLTKNILESHGAGIMITNVTAHFESDSSPSTKVMVEVSFIREEI